jgi:hypothetical protein
VELTVLLLHPPQIAIGVLQLEQRGGASHQGGWGEGHCVWVGGEACARSVGWVGVVVVHQDMERGTIRICSMCRTFLIIKENLCQKRQEASLYSQQGVCV